MIVNRAALGISMALAACSGGTGARPAPRPTPQPAAPGRIAILVTVDGLMPDAYTAPDEHELAVPTLRRIVREGAWATMNCVPITPARNPTTVFASPPIPMTPIESAS